MHIALIHGPNFRFLDQRDATVYGRFSLCDIEESLYERAGICGFSLQCSSFQSNIEGALIDYIESVYEQKNVDGIILNAGAYTHTSIAIADCLSWIPVPVVEVHISQIFAREPMRRVSMIAPYCISSITGCGILGYSFALELLAQHSATRTEK